MSIQLDGEFNRPIELATKLQGVTGNSEEAEQERRLLAEKLADQILRDANLEFADLPRIRAALIRLLGDPQPAWDYAPQWAQESTEGFLREIAGILGESSAADEIVTDFENYANSMAPLADLAEWNDAPPPDEGSSAW